MKTAQFEEMMQDPKNRIAIFLGDLRVGMMSPLLPKTQIISAATGKDQSARCAVTSIASICEVNFQ